MKASIETRPRSPFFYARIWRYNAALGRWARTRLSTKIPAEPRNRRKAKALADQLQQAALAAGPDQNPTAEDCRRMLDAVMGAAGVESHAIPPQFSEYARRWLNIRAGRASPQTIEVYRSRINRFVGWGGDRRIDQIDGRHMQSFYEAMGASTHAALLVDTVSQVFNRAINEGVLTRNPARLVEKKPQRGDRQAKRLPFTDQEIETIERFLRSGDHGTAGFAPYAQGWLTALAIGHDTGARISDAAGMRADAVQGSALVWREQKTRRTRAVPIGRMLAARLCEVEPGEFLCGALGAVKNGRGNGLSIQFRQILDACGITDRRKTFHSLRHKLVQDMERAGVDPAMRMRIIGHHSRAAHEHYERTGVDLAEVEALRAALGR